MVCWLHMSKEIPLQADMFTGELVDNRTRRQKKRDRERTQLRQAELFSTREVAQFGVRANPKIPLSPKTRLELAAEDPRTEEERAHDLKRELEEKTCRLLPEENPAETQADQYETTKMAEDDGARETQ